MQETKRIQFSVQELKNRLRIRREFNNFASFRLSFLYLYLYLSNILCHLVSFLIQQFKQEHRAQYLGIMLKVRLFAHQTLNYPRMSYFEKIVKRFINSQQWITRQQSDPYVEKAKVYNYRCRSAFKLLEINKKTNILKPGLTVIDLGASPGSWTQVAVQKTNADGAKQFEPKGKVISIDKLYTFPIEGATILNHMDFSTVEAHNNVLEMLNETKVDVVISDMAPSATGVRELDKDRIIGLCYMALRFAALVSKIDGSLLFKVWDGKEVPILVMDLQKFYNTIKIIKPMASRSESSEKFILARGFRGIQRPLKNGRWGENESNN